MENLLVDLKTGDKIKVKVGNLVFGEDEKIIISGPCSVEEFETMRNIAKILKEKGVHMLRGGAFKPRTSPYDFQGLGFEGFKILKDIREEFNTPVVSEVLDTRHVEKALDYIDMIQIGSRNMYNYSLLKEVGKTNKPILLKRGMSATLKEWLNAAEYIMAEGNNNVVLCERGIRTFENYTRNTLDLNSVAIIKEKYRLPVIVDPSHGTGIRSIVPIMSMAAIAAGADGIMIESHINPEESISDSDETVSLETVGNIVDNIKKGRLF
ncbi:3-deoxy-7-phosphoheptulonate synthase [Clostridium cochlearium]|uniref:3-deoxy-D-arabinoheptulosonate-7-phosphate synthase n=1 Tax=Clostridium cochlearium TaxID=1494 RepID=A0ABY0QKK8_CLOCO|nr:3-deoxy-7-phosphoheptulonate synthase [Clostridium cochlearium]SDL07213.1 3-deoxy-D-arabinoheptulosonate-7-phosphate synthase [Clostridium cochlearium]SNV80180.1 3-deoxy-7-phosphoheptulonate synthase [Clostridium cochlearium]STA92824.1 3-deoxy-7-phosphoheptulonate synthase [Clostridium cochlearium]